MVLPPASTTTTASTTNSPGTSTGTAASDRRFNCWCRRKSSATLLISVAAAGGSVAVIVAIANVYSHAIAWARVRVKRVPIHVQSEVPQAILSEIRTRQNVSNTGTQSMVDGSPRAQTRNHLKSNHERQTLYQWIIRSNVGSGALTQYNNTDSIFGECVRTLDIVYRRTSNCWLSGARNRMLEELLLHLDERTKLQVWYRRFHLQSLSKFRTRTKQDICTNGIFGAMWGYIRAEAICGDIEKCMQQDEGHCGVFFLPERTFFSIDE